MPQRIKRFSVGQTAKMFGIVYGILGILLMPFFWIMGRLAPGASPYGTGFVLALPILYGGLGLVFTAIGCWIYNWVAGWAGGIEVELGDAPQA